MNKEKERLLHMLKENNISENDYKLLFEALDKKTLLLNIESSILINPFQKIAGVKALLIGLIFMIAMSILGLMANVYFDGIFGCLFAGNIKTEYKPEFFLLLYQNVVNWLLLTILFLTAAILFRQKRIRIIDFIGMVAFSRYPFLILVAFFALLKFVYPAFFNIDSSKGYELHLTILGTLVTLIFTSCFVWQLLTYFFALKEASGLKGKSLWISFLATMMLGDVISIILARAFLYS